MCVKKTYLFCDLKKDNIFAPLIRNTENSNIKKEKL